MLTQLRIDGSLSLPFSPMSPPYVFALRSAPIPIQPSGVNVLSSNHRQPPPFSSCPRWSCQGDQSKIFLMKSPTSQPPSTPLVLKLKLPQRRKLPQHCASTQALSMPQAFLMPQASPQCNTAGPRLNTASDFLKLSRTTLPS
ncbi:hypothetical protein B0H16DRAFT_1894702 [Mycena metata]|uniref:Uncharacterized protein n=1 Tax=Mycena metata TaxID=1033252 RepID=A0AAD7HSL9_9AGAR|nr:hypothetical protein B0H16DRAFT_1894702 [Mycena metata]